MHKQQNRSQQLIYKLGLMSWYYRSVTLMIHAAAVLTLYGVYSLIEDYSKQPSLETFVLILLTLLLFVLWGVTVCNAWTDSLSRAVRIAVLADQEKVAVRTLSFITRHILVKDFKKFEYQNTQFSSRSGRYYAPRLIVYIKGDFPIEIDLLGCIPDKQAFNSIFQTKLK